MSEAADVNATADGGVTPLHVAANFGSPTIVSALLDAYANASAVTSDGLTALHLLAAPPSPDTATAICDVISAVDWLGTTHPHPRLVKALLLSLDTLNSDMLDSSIVAAVCALSKEYHAPERNPFATRNAEDGTVVALPHVTEAVTPKLPAQSKGLFGVRYISVSFFKINYFIFWILSSCKYIFR